MAIATDNLLIQAKTDVYHRVLGDAVLANVSVVVDDEHDLDARAAVDAGPENYRAGKTGACVVVSAVGVLGTTQAQTPTPLMTMLVVCEVLEDVVVNGGPDGSGVNAGEIVARLVQLMHQVHIDDRFSGLRLAQAQPITELFAEQQGRRGYQVRFQADQLNFRQVASVQSVDISESAGEITLTCATTGATIYYTTDGSYPGSGNDAASTYSAPFSPGSGVTVRAAAEKTDLNPSQLVASHTTA